MIPKHSLELIKAIKDTGAKLSTMEKGFIASVSIQSNQNRMLTDKQAKYLQDIYARVTGGGQHQPKEFIDGRS